MLTTPNYISLLDGLFAGPVAGAFDPQLYGEFAIAPQTRLADLAAMYDTRVAAEDAEMTVAELLRQELAGDIEQGDRIPYGPIDLIVRSVDDDHQIVDVGLALEHTHAAAAADPIVPGPEGDHRAAAILARVVARDGRDAGRTATATARATARRHRLPSE